MAKEKAGAQGSAEQDNQKLDPRTERQKARAEAEEKASLAVAAEIEAHLTGWLQDRLEAEIVRHERCFEDFVGGTCALDPPLLDSRELHELRLAVVKMRDGASSAVLAPLVGKLRAYRFVYPETAVSNAAGVSPGGST
jgi:hypothetical protein